MVQKTLQKCYLCGNEIMDMDQAEKVPTTEGDAVFTHLSCLQFYLAELNKPSACGSCASASSCGASPSSCGVSH